MSSLSAGADHEQQRRVVPTGPEAAKQFLICLVARLTGQAKVVAQRRYRMGRGEAAEHSEQQPSTEHQKPVPHHEAGQAGHDALLGVRGSKRGPADIPLCQV